MKWSALIAAVAGLPSFAFAQAPCPAACTVTLPAVTWDAIGGALNDAIKMRQDLFGELSRQLREQMPKADSIPAAPTEPKAP